MVKIALAGGSGNVGQEILEALVAAGKHEILLLSRKDPGDKALPSCITWLKVNYDDVDELARVFQGVNTVLSFTSPGNSIQKNIIDAAVRAGVKRFAPSEWSSSRFDCFEVYATKGETREYLANLNKDKKVLEYCLFQPGWFTNYMTYPFKSSDHIELFETPIDFHNCRALLVEGRENDLMTLTTSQDLARVVAQAVEYEGEWPVVGGAKGTEISIGDLVALGEKIRGRPFKVEKLKAEDLEKEIVKSSWLPKFAHPSIPDELVPGLIKGFTSKFLLSLSLGTWNVSDDWNKLLPDFKFTQAEEFLTKAWKDKE